MIRFHVNEVGLQQGAAGCSEGGGRKQEAVLFLSIKRSFPKARDRENNFF